jgi:hypothetical protein
MVAKLFRNLKSANQAGGNSGRGLALGDLEDGLHNNLAAMKMIDQ